LISDDQALKESKHWLNRAFAIRTSDKEYFEYCFRQHGAIKLFSGFNPSIVIQAEYVGETPNDAVVEVREFPSLELKFSDWRHNEDKSFCCIKASMNGKFLCARSNRQSWMSKLLEVLWTSFSLQERNSHELLDFHRLRQDKMKEWFFEGFVSRETSFLHPLQSEAYKALQVLKKWFFEGFVSRVTSFLPPLQSEAYKALQVLKKWFFEGFVSRVTSFLPPLQSEAYKALQVLVFWLVGMVIAFMVVHCFAPATTADKINFNQKRAVEETIQKVLSWAEKRIRRDDSIRTSWL